MSGTVTVTLVDGVRVVVNDSLEQITPYVLREQHDWFEDELRFVRRWLQPGNRVIDVGANHGVYSLAMAKVVGPQGAVWSFEPSTATANLLERSISSNGFTQSHLVRAAVSDHMGQAQLALASHSEWNALVRGDAPAGATETVPLVTLDDGLERHGWRDIDLLKLDAEGEEVRILKGGKRFFAEQSPLVLFEIRAGMQLQLNLVQAFAARGYRSYRLMPGLDVLVPFDPLAEPDGFMLNLFACKPDRAERLAAMGRLVQDPGDAGVRQLPRAGEWQQRLMPLPYAASLAPMWSRTLGQGRSGEVLAALALHARAHDEALDAKGRVAALLASLALLKSASAQASPFLRLSSLARVAAECGERELAVRALNQLSTDLLAGKEHDPGEPFLAASARFDGITPGDVVGNWVLAATLEAAEKLDSHSSFFAGEANRQRLEIIQALGFAGDEMARRLDLVRRRFDPMSSSQEHRP